MCRLAFACILFLFLAAANVSVASERSDAPARADQTPIAVINTKDVLRRSVALQRAVAQLNREHETNPMPSAQLAKRESRIYHNAFTDMQSEVARFCSEHGINLVLNRSDPEGVFRPCCQLYINEGDVFYFDRIDITESIVDRMNATFKIE